MRVSVLLLVLVLLFSLATGAAAATVGYLDGMAGGAVEKESSFANGEDDLEVTILSAGTLVNEKIKIGAEFGAGTVKGEPENDLILWSVKAGYRLVDQLAFKLDAIVAPLVIDTEDSMLRTTLLGVDAALYFSEKMFLTASYVMGNGTYELSGFERDDGTSVDMLRLKLHYFVTEKVGLVAGYTKLQYKFDAAMGAMKLGEMEVGMGGPTLGLVYKF